MKRIYTSYGYKQPGKSPFVIIAPHASGDDLKTATITRRLAERLDAFSVINRRFFKKTNYKAKDKPEFIEDFNQLYWSFLKNQYLWRSKKVAMKEFYSDISKYCNQARKFTKDKDNKVLAIYIHGIKDDDIAIDLGVGVKAKGTQNKFIDSFKIGEKNSGKATLKIGYLKKIRKQLNQATREVFDLPTTVGKKHIGWSKKSAIQFHKHEGRNDYSVQLEINPLLRQKNNREFLVKLLAETFNSVFNQN